MRELSEVMTQALEAELLHYCPFCGDLAHGSAGDAAPPADYCSHLIDEDQLRDELAELRSAPRS